MEEYKTMWKNFAVFDGRSTRRDYWMAVLFNFVISLAIGVVAGVINLGFISILYSIATIIPSLAMLVRRLHDTNKSALCILLSFIPLIGGIILLVFLCQGSVEEGNKYGEIVQ